MAVQLAAKRAELLHNLIPNASRVALLVNPTNPLTESLIKDAQAAASSIGLRIDILPASANHDIDGAFASLLQRRAEALMIGPDTLFANRRLDIALLAVRHAIPTIFPFRDDAEAGGLMSYGASVAEEFRLAGIYTGRILKGDKPAELPVMQPTKFEFVLNLKTERALGLEIPPTLLALADEVIE
jgi:putative ABC transport system substrate-binding protein